MTATLRVLANSPGTKRTATAGGAVVQTGSGQALCGSAATACGTDLNRAEAGKLDTRRNEAVRANIQEGCNVSRAALKDALA